MTRRQRDIGLTTAIRAAGSISLLAKSIQLSVQAVSQWYSVPVNRCIVVEQATGIHRSVLRPDVFGDAPHSEHTPINDRDASISDAVPGAAMS